MQFNLLITFFGIQWAEVPVTRPFKPVFTPLFGGVFPAGFLKEPGSFWSF
jgi:hypothetical protein